MEMKSNIKSGVKSISKSLEKNIKNAKNILTERGNPEVRPLKLKKNNNKNDKIKQKNNIKDQEIDIINQLKEAKEIEDLKIIYKNWNREKAYLNEKNRILKTLDKNEILNKKFEESVKINNRKKSIEKIIKRNKSLEKKQILQKIRELKKRKEMENDKEYIDEDIKKLEKKMKRDLNSIFQKEYLLLEKDNEKNENFIEKFEYIKEVEKYIQNEIKINKEDKLILSDKAEKDEENILIKFLGYIGSELSLKNIKTYIELNPTNEKLREITFKIIMSGLANQEVYKLTLDNEDEHILFYQNVDKWFSFIENIKNRISNIYNISTNNIYFFNHNLNTFEVNLLIYDKKVYKIENILKNYNLKATKSELLNEIIISTNIFEINFCKNEDEWPKKNLVRGGKKYSPPYGWIGIALKIDSKYDKNDIIWFGNKNKEGEWPVAYYGIGKGNVFKKIITLIINNLKKSSEKYDKIEDNNQNKFIFGSEDVNLTPNINDAMEEADKISIGFNNSKVKFVIMARVNPNKIRNKNNNILKEEWILKANNQEIRPYRLLFKTF